MLAYNYPLLGAFLTILWFSLFFIWISAFHHRYHRCLP